MKELVLIKHKPTQGFIHFCNQQKLYLLKSGKLGAAVFNRTDALAFLTHYLNVNSNEWELTPLPTDSKII